MCALRRTAQIGPILEFLFRDVLKAVGFFSGGNFLFFFFYSPSALFISIWDSTTLNADIFPLWDAACLSWLCLEDSPSPSANCDRKARKQTKINHLQWKCCWPLRLGWKRVKGWIEILPFSAAKYSQSNGGNMIIQKRRKKKQTQHKCLTRDKRTAGDVQLRGCLHRLKPGNDY